jgi:branched-chain amino acid transport system substrate-binding protein
VLTWTEALRRADAAGKLNGPGIREALESLNNYDLGGLTPPVTYTKDDHRSTTSVSLYQVKGGKLVKVKDVDLPRKPEWLGL